MNNRKNFFDIKKHTIFDMPTIGGYPRTYFVAELKVLINNLKPDSREHEKACTLKSRIKKTNKNRTFSAGKVGRAGRADKENLPQVDWRYPSSIHMWIKIISTM
ncbi:unnamed protein product [Rhizophagus irregularis]|nr:unnamed protein product [Rhizophagus irregularis]CAB5356873.1 unnamed protein product [Rhizophagus irregularis]